MNLIVGMILAIALAACDGADAPAVSQQPSPLAAAPDSTLVRSDDAELRQLAAALLPGLAARSGFELREPVRVERRSRAELERYLLAKLDEELDVEHAAALAESYRLLGLVPESTDLRALLLNVYREQVAGFYDPDSTALFVLDDQPEEAVESLLLHELVHAVQDQSVDLDSLTDPQLDSDRRVAAQAAIEGHATLVMLEFMLEQGGAGSVDLAEVPAMADQLRPALEAARDQYPALAAAPPVVQHGLLFPYVEGAGYALAAWQHDARRGEVLRSLLPQSSEQVLDPASAWGAAVDLPETLHFEAEDGMFGQRLRFSEVLGQSELGLWLESLGLDRTLARGWDGDRYALLELSADAVIPADAATPANAATPAHALLLAIVWDTAEQRDDFVRALAPALAEFAADRGLPAGLEARPFAGRPGALIKLGLDEAGAWSVRLGGVELGGVEP